MGSGAERPLGWAGQVQGGFQKEVGFVELFATLEVTCVGMMPQAEEWKVGGWEEVQNTLCTEACGPPRACSTNSQAAQHDKGTDTRPTAGDSDKPGLRLWSRPLPVPKLLPCSPNPRLSLVCQMLRALWYPGLSSSVPWILHLPWASHARWMLLISAQIPRLVSPSLSCRAVGCSQLTPFQRLLLADGRHVTWSFLGGSEQ